MLDTVMTAIYLVISTAKRESSLFNRFLFKLNFIFSDVSKRFRNYLQCAAKLSVPLSSATDDEWGWEDGSTEGDIELGGADVEKDDDDLQMALALSMSEQTSKKSSSSSSLIPEKPSGSPISPLVEPSNYRSSPVNHDLGTKREYLFAPP